MGHFGGSWLLLCGPLSLLFPGVLCSALLYSARELLLIVLLIGTFGYPFRNLAPSSPHPFDPPPNTSRNGLTANKMKAFPLSSPWVMTVAFGGSAGKFAASAGMDQQVSLTDLEAEGVKQFHLGNEDDQHTGCIYCARFVNKGTVLTASGDSTCKTWDVETQKAVQSFAEHGADVV